MTAMRSCAGVQSTQSRQRAELILICSCRRSSSVLQKLAIGSTRGRDAPGFQCSTCMFENGSSIGPPKEKGRPEGRPDDLALIVLLGDAALQVRPLQGD